MEFKPLIEKITQYDYSGLIPVLALLLLGWFSVRVVPSVIGRILHNRLTHHTKVVVHRLITYGLLILFLTLILNQLGIKLSVLMGAAGILTVALGFASQTSVSNVISGLFLLGEKPFALGDVIQVDTHIGEVISVGLLSVKIRTFQNGYLRIPNEVLIKTTVNTLTRYPIRRVDLKVGISYKNDIEEAKKLIMDYVDVTPEYLKEPEPIFVVEGFADSSINLLIGVWVPREQFLALKNKLHIDIQKLFWKNNIEIPFPQVTLTIDPDSNPMKMIMPNAENDY